MTFDDANLPNSPVSLATVLKRTTRTPLFCHPKQWREVHFDILQVEGLDKTYPLDYVVGRPVISDPSDTALQEAMGPKNLFRSNCDAIDHAFSEDEWMGDRRNQQRELLLADICRDWLRGLREKVRHYPTFDFDVRNG